MMESRELMVWLTAGSFGQMVARSDELGDAIEAGAVEIISDLDVIAAVSTTAAGRRLMLPPMPIGSA